MRSQLLQRWLARVVARESPPSSVVAYNIGLFETDDGYCAYLAGAERFDPDDDDWACDKAFTPTERYLEVPRATAGTSDWAEFLHNVANEVKAFLASDEGRRSFLAKADAVTVGFDEGDLLRIR